MQQINLTRLVATSLMGLIREDNRSWEAIAVDVLRQKAWWDNMKLEDCEDDSLDTPLEFLLHLDKYAFIDFIVNFEWTLDTAINHLLQKSGEITIGFDWFECGHANTLSGIKT